MLYTTKKDLRFELMTGRTYDKDGEEYDGSAVEKNGHVFFPLDLVCRHFGLSWSLSDTAYAPLVRIKSDSAKLSDRSFIDAASLMLASRYAAYEKLVNSTQPPEEDQNGNTGEDADDNKNNNKDDNKGNEPQKDPVEDPPPIQALDGQRTYLILNGQSAESVWEAMELLGDSPATFLLTVQQMEDGDLIRAVLGSGHAIALLVQSGAADEVGEELLRARELVWNASCSLLQFVWCEGDDVPTQLWSSA